jgi:hypothetical protein
MTGLIRRKHVKLYVWQTMILEKLVEAELIRIGEDLNRPITLTEMNMKKLRQMLLDAESVTVTTRKKDNADNNKAA